MYYNKSLKQYLDDLAAKKPAPGGGSAAALSAAMGASLLSMVVHFTVGKPRYAHYEPELQEILKVSERLRKDFLGLVDLDIKAYRSQDPRKALDVPFMVCRLSCDALEVCPELAKKGNVNLASDVAVAAALLEAAFMSSYFNVEINLKCLNDEAFTVNIKKELDEKMKKVKKLRFNTEALVGEIIRG
ncbi:MAG: cyclodeaminase/cyclohydrolase family protein [Candidatus Omnitrophota bacterium]